MLKFNSLFVVLSFISFHAQFTLNHFRSWILFCDTFDGGKSIHTYMVNVSFFFLSNLDFAIMSSITSPLYCQGSYVRRKMIWMHPGSKGLWSVTMISFLKSILCERMFDVLNYIMVKNYHMFWTIFVTTTSKILFNMLCTSLDSLKILHCWYVTLQGWQGMGFPLHKVITSEL